MENQLYFVLEANNRFPRKNKADFPILVTHKTFVLHIL